MAISREYPPCPILGTGVMVFRGDDVLLVRRGHQPSMGKWSIPGGRVELGETVRAAALRELAEECGPDLEVEIVSIAMVLDRVAKDELGRVQYHYCLVDFAARYVGGEITAGTDADEACWFPIGGLRELDTTNRLEELIGQVHERLGLDGHGLPIEVADF